jgi:hypothetical protein
MAFVFVLAPARIARGNREALIPFISPFFFSPVSRPHNKFETLLAHSRAFSQREKKARERENRIRRARYGKFLFFFCPLRLPILELTFYASCPVHQARVPWSAALLASRALTGLTSGCFRPLSPCHGCLPHRFKQAASDYPHSLSVTDGLARKLSVTVSDPLQVMRVALALRPCPDSTVTYCDGWKLEMRSPSSST